MKSARYLISCLWAVFGISGAAQAASLDDLYRDIIRSDNEGYLPLFVKNRSTPDILNEESYNADAKNNLQQTRHPINLTNNRLQKEAFVRARQLRWNKTLKAVEENRATPLDLSEITYRVSLNDAKAVEVLAWMYTRGVGVRQDLPAAFRLYRQAEKLQVPQAAENAALVYKAMTPEQRALLK